MLILGGFAAAGVAYSIGRGSTPWSPAAAVAAASADPGSAGAGPASVGRARPASVRVNPNTAGKAELELLPGIGPALADRIIAERRRGGRFDRPEDLARVPGIGPRTIERVRGMLEFD